jgi:hypothetical protein
LASVHLAFAHLALNNPFAPLPCAHETTGKGKHMSDPTASPPDPAGMNRAETLSARFAQMVLQQVQLAMMLLGKTPHPQTGRAMRDLDGARTFIDQLEMIAEKTKGNLTLEEEQLLKQSLMSLRLAFVEAVESPPPEPPPSPGNTAPTGPAEGPAAAAPETAPAPDAESKKKFSKKY